MNAHTTQTIALGLKTRHPSLAEQPDKVEAKVASLKRGLGYFIIGGTLLLVAVVVFLVVVVLFRDRELGIMFAVMALALPGLMGLAGIYLIFAGGNVASGEAMRAAAEDLQGVGGFAAKLIAKAHKST